MAAQHGQTLQQQHRFFMHIDDIKKVLEILNPNDKVDFTFDKYCISQVHVNFADGKPYFDVQVTYNKAKCTIKGYSYYIPCYYQTIMNFLDFRKQFMEGPCDISPEFLSSLKACYDMKMLNRPNNCFEDQLESLKNLSGLSENEIKQKAGIPV